MKRLLHVCQCRTVISLNNHGAPGLRRYLCQTPGLSSSVPTEIGGAQPLDDGESRSVPLRKVPTGPPVSAAKTKRASRSSLRPSGRSDISGATRERVRAGFTWFTKDPALVNLEDLRSILPNYCDGKATVKTIVVLVTPSLASLIEPGDFPKKLLPALFRGHRSFESKASKDIVKCIYAVVDALPTPSGSTPRLLGTEGLSVFLSSDEGSRNSAYAPARTHDEAETGSTPTLKFASTAASSDVGAEADQTTVTTWLVSLPGANTIFVNGQRATMFEDRWKIQLRETGDPVINYLYRKPLSSYRIGLRCHPNGFVRGGSSPLQQLTKPRKVVGSMGNVLAQIEIDGQTVPASQELEEAVPKYIASNPACTAKGPVLVYALICPETMVPSYESSIGGQPNCSERILGALWRGAKLFKVSGGGGGWGKRQGLLSLDAAVDFGGSKAPSPAEPPDFDGNQSILEAFGSRGIIPKSSTVEFLVHSPSSASTESESEDHLSLGSEGESTTVILGTTMDPESHELMKVDAMDEGVRFVPNHFGMISYGGSALRSSEGVPGRRSVTRGETRLDVPDSFFVLRGVGKYRIPNSLLETQRTI